MLEGMPKSRSRRRPRNRPPSGRTRVATLRPGQSLEHLLTERDLEEIRAETDAEARGDARAAWEHHMAGLVVEESLRRHQLRELADLGAAAPGWMFSRWCLDQAYRWMLFTEDPRADEMVRLVLAATHADHLDTVVGDPGALKEYGTLVAASDWLVQQLCVYSAGGLRDFLDLRAQPELLARADRISEWAAAPMRVHRLEEMRGSVLVVRDLVDDESRELLNLGAFNEGYLGDHVLGRLVPISAPPHLMFDSRPVSLDAPTANHAAAAIRRGGDADWLDALMVARDEGRLERGFSCRQTTLYSTDLVADPAAAEDARVERPGRMLELLEAGLDEHVANGVMVAEVALIAAVIDGGSVGAVGPHLSAVLVDSRILAAVRTHCTAPDREAAWRTLAASTTSPVSDRCLALAEHCRTRAA